jgi:hypothetical protein
MQTLIFRYSAKPKRNTRNLPQSHLPPLQQLGQSSSSHRLICSSASKNQAYRVREPGQCCKLGTVMEPTAMAALFALQCFHVLFLALHDWVPLGTLNDVKAVRVANPGRKLVAGALISLTPFAIGLAASAIHFGRAYPSWLFWWLWISYGLLFVGELTAWWIPYLFHAEPERAARYQVMFGATHFSTPTQRHPGEHTACDTPRSNAHHIGNPRRSHEITGPAYLLSGRIGGPSFRLPRSIIVQCREGLPRLLPRKWFQHTSV